MTWAMYKERAGHNHEILKARHHFHKEVHQRDIHIQRVTTAEIPSEKAIGILINIRTINVPNKIIIAMDDSVILVLLSLTLHWQTLRESP